MTGPDEVRLSVPAMPEFLRLIRVTAAGLGSRLGFSYDEVEDLRLAIDELCIGLTGKTGRDGTVHVRFRVDGDALEVTAEGHFGDNALFTPHESAWSRIILEALVDDHELAPGPEGPRFRLVKRTASPRPPAAAPA